MIRAYYNEIEPFAAAWLRNLIAAGLICPGDVDERDIRDILPSDLEGYTRHHFFAGLGGWDYALQLAGWPDDRPVWTGSCPCQPFSAAGKGAGFADERHLWPAWHWLIGQSRPPCIFGEQVAAKAVEPWIDLVQADLEALGYAFDAIPFPAASVGAPHIRDRLSFVADASAIGHPIGHVGSRAQDGWSGSGAAAMRRDRAGELADSIGERLEGRDDRSLGNERPPAQRGGAVGLVGHANGAGREARDRIAIGIEPRPEQPTHPGFWGGADWLPCRDGKARPVEPGTFPLAHGIPGRVGRLRAYGNAIVPQAQAEFIKAYLDQG